MQRDLEKYIYFATFEESYLGLKVILALTAKGPF